MSRAHRKFNNQMRKQEKSHEEWIQLEFKRIKTYKKHLGSKFKGRLLDLGCGPDYFSQALRLKGISAEGIDINTSNFETDQLPYNNDTFDIITMNNVIEHIWNPENIFKEINRVLKRQGYLIIKSKDWNQSPKTFNDDHTRKRIYTKHTLKNLFMMHGMKIIELSGGSIPPWKSSEIIAIAQRMK